MQETQTTHRPRYAPTSPGIDGTEKQPISIIQQWKDLRALLAQTVQNYLVACADLNDLCTNPQKLPSEQLVIENALASIDSELSIMTSEEDKLRQARIKLTETRNRSFSLAPINKLPPEILSHIFIMSKSYCVYSDKDCNPSTRLFLDTFSGVSTRWRRIAIDTPVLWTHIDISPQIDMTQLYQRAEIQLKRSRELPIQLHVWETGQTDDDTPDRAAILRMTDFLAPHMTRVNTIDLETNSYSRQLFRSALYCWLDNGYPGSAQSLSIYRPGGDIFFSIGDEIEHTYQIKSKEHVEDILLPLRTLHLHNASFGWGSTAYRGLVDLQIHSCTETVIVSVSQMATVLACSPGLVVLKLGNVQLQMPEGSENPKSVALNSLEVLGLGHMHHDSLHLLLPLISPSKLPGRLSVCISMAAGFSLASECKAFFARSEVAVLCVQNDGWGASPANVFPALEQLPGIDTLGICEYDFLDFPPPEISTTTEPDAPSSSLPASTIPVLFISSCKVTLKSLIHLVSKYGIQNLHLRSCKPLTEKDTGSALSTIEEFRTSLCNAYPELKFAISEECISQEWQCCIAPPCYTPDR